MADKIADAAVLPHPFVTLNEAETVVLLDPMCRLVEDAVHLTQGGGEIDGADLPHSGYVSIGNEDLCSIKSRKGVSGVMMVSASL